MELKIDISKKYGLVLEGGGAKGAYQIGIWRAFKETGLKIKGIAGASVGALNGALICMDDFDKALYIWENISYSQVMDVDDAQAEAIAKKEFSRINGAALITAFKRVLNEGGLDITPLRNLIEEVVDEKRIRESYRDLYVTTVNLDLMKEEVIDIKTVNKGEIGDYLMASAYFPAFKLEKLAGSRYLDGGSINNVPVDILIEHGYQDIIVLRLMGLGINKEIFTKIPKDTNVYHIIPRQNLGGTLEFSAARAKHNIRLGYFDGMRFLYGLSGRKYYIDAPEKEDYYLSMLFDEMDILNYYINEEFISTEREYSIRFMTEKLFPKMASELKLRQKWNYKDLFVRLLEDAATRLNVDRYQVYTVDKLKDAIHEKFAKNQKLEMREEETETEYIEEDN